MVMICGVEVFCFEVGVFEVGCLVDFIVFDFDGFYVMLFFDVVYYLVFVVGWVDVCDVYVSGRCVVENWCLVNFDFEFLCQEIVVLVLQIVVIFEGFGV